MAAIDGLLVRATPGEFRFALTAAGQIVEIRIDRGDAAPGDILLGRVLTRLPALNAALVEIGQPLPGFLTHAGSVSEGQLLPVQVTASARGEKGAELSAQPSLQGKLLAYSPFRPGFSQSRRILDEADRARIAALLKPLRREDEGLVVRTQAAGQPDKALLAELEELRRQWTGLKSQIAEAKGPGPLRVPDPLERLLAEHGGIRSVRTDDRTTQSWLRARFPSAAFSPDAFAEAEDELEQALTRRIGLPGGGSLEIGTVAGITLIDIDSGAGSPLQANLAAVPEIARHIRLRNLSGRILVDMIPMQERRATAQVAEALRQAVSYDPTPTQVSGTTPMGMVEIIRERKGPSLAETMLAPAAEPGRSADSMALEALAALLKEAETRSGRRLGLAAAPAVSAALRRRPQAIAETERRLGHSLSLRDDPVLTGWSIVEGTQS